MSEKLKHFPPVYDAENGKNPKEGSDWLGGPQNGNEPPSEAAPSSLDSNPVTSTKNDETWSGRGRRPGHSGILPTSGPSWRKHPKRNTQASQHLR
jgi:DNA-binding protein H-NS